MANIQITQLPPAEPLTGTESVPIVQNGITVQTTTANIAQSPVLQQTFLTVNLESSLPNSRYFATDNNMTITDNGALSTYRISLTGALTELNTAGNGFLVKTGVSTLTPRNIAVTGSGIAIANGDGQSGNPTIGLSGLPLILAQATGSGLLALNSGSSLSPVTITGTASQITVSNGNGVGGNPTLSLTDTGVTSGSYTFANITVDAQGRITSASNGTSIGVSSFSAGTTGFTPGTSTTGAVTLSGTLNVSHGGSGATTLTGYLIGNGTSAFTATLTIPTADLSGTIANAQLANSSITINGTPVSLGGSATISATVSTLTFGTGLTGTSYNGTAPITTAIDTSVVATLTDTQILTNKTISGANNTLSNIGNSSLTNSSITINGSAISLGGSVSVGTVTAVGASAPLASTGGATPVLSITKASSTVDGYLSSTDWNTFNNKGNGTVTSVTGTSPIASTGGATPAISISQATTSTDGYLTSTDWNTFNSKGSGTVTSVGLSLPSFITVTNSPVTGSGTLTGTLATQTANYVFAGPSSGSATAPTFRALVSADIPNNAANTSGTATNASNVAITTGSGTTNYLSFVTATSGNNPVLVDSSLTYNASTHALTSGILGGTF